MSSLHLILVQHSNRCAFVAKPTPRRKYLAASIEDSDDEIDNVGLDPENTQQLHREDNDLEEEEIGHAQDFDDEGSNVEDGDQQMPDDPTAIKRQLIMEASTLYYVDKY